MFYYFWVFVKWIKPLPPGPQLSNSYHQIKYQKNSDLLCVKICTDLATYALYKCLKYITDEKLNEVYYQPDNFWTVSNAVKELNKIK